MSIRDPFTERFSSLPSKPLNLFAVPYSITSVFPFLRFMISSLSRNQEARLPMSSLRLCWITSKSFEDVKITVSSSKVIILE